MSLSDAVSDRSIDMLPAAPPAAPHRVVLAMSHEAFNRGVALGVREIIRTGLRWRLQSANASEEWVDRIAAWRPDGIILHSFCPPATKRLLALGVPVVEVGGGEAGDQLVRVSVDDEAIGRMACAHLQQRGHQRLAWLGTGEPFSRRRQEAFVRAAHAAGRTCAVLVGGFNYNDHDKMAWSTIEDTIGQWLKGLPRPCGLACANDTMALMVTEIAADLGLAVPTDIGVLGVDNDDLICRLADPALSSIALPLQQLGMEAAQALARLLAGESPPAKPLLLPPKRVVERHSTSAMAITDEVVAAAMAVLAERGSSIDGIDMLAATVGVPRRTLERRFRLATGASPLAALIDEHLRLAQVLLAETNLPMADVARRSGFASVDRLQVAFRRHRGISPSRWRAQTGPGRS